MGEVINLRDHLQKYPPRDHGCLGDRNGKCALCQIRTLREVDLPSDVEPVKDFSE